MSNNKQYKSPSKKKSFGSSLISSNIITTPCEKVLSILREVKNFLFSIAKDQKKLIQKLDWAIKIITSRSLYSYELKEKEAINKLSKENPDFKQLVDFVSEYNEKVIKMNRKYNYILTDKLLLKPSTKLNRKKIERKSSFSLKNPNLYDLLKVDETRPQNSEVKRFISNKTNNFGFLRLNKNKIIKIKTTNVDTNNHSMTITNSNINNEMQLNQKIIKKENNLFESHFLKKKLNQRKFKKPLININDDSFKKTKSVEKENQNFSFFNNNTLNFTSHKSDNIFEDSFKKINIDPKLKNRYTLFPSVQKISITINNNEDNKGNIILKKEGESKANKSFKRRNTLINEVNISLTNSILCNNDSNLRKYRRLKTNKNIPYFSKGYSFQRIQNQITQEGYESSKLITDKNFDIFQLRDLVGYNNVLPFAGRIILENIGLIDEEILNLEKLDPFLVEVSNHYKPQTLYHNCLHGTDVTQSCYIFFSHTNAEKIAKTNVLDLLSIFIAALGHDIGHPGLTNTFHINDSTDMAITYNDISVLENFHASTLFKIIRKSETNIFDKLTTIDYKIIRKRMICEILATDMANHGKVTSLIKSKISISEDGKDYKLNLLTGNEQTKNDEQQCLLDFLIHLADLAHNTRLFRISLKWVELLSEEFWRQGDLEKKKNLPVSFLCDREDTDVPKSQKGFISGFILPTFKCLSSIFPTLKFTVENANNNLKEWQKLLDEGRKTGWTPPKNRKESLGVESNDDSEKVIKNINKNNTAKKPNNLPKLSNKQINSNTIKSIKIEEKSKRSYKNTSEDFSKGENKNKRKDFITPVKSRNSGEFSLSKEKNYNNNCKTISNKCNITKNVNKGMNKKNVNKKK